MLQAGDVIGGKYRIIKVAGKGGMSTVYLAEHMGLGTKRAVKEICRQRCGYFDSIQQGMEREIHILKQLDYPGLPRIMDIFSQQDSLLIVMEYIEGKTLKQILEERGHIEERQAVAWAKQICGILHYLHTRNPPVIYRDLKPSNLMLKKDGNLALVDFGTAREYRRKKDGGDTVCLGTRGYAAPEQYGSGGQTDERTDIYCFGITMYQLLTGKSPEKPPYKIYPVRYWRAELSPGLEAVILKCTRQNPEERYESSLEVLYALENLRENDRRYRRKEWKKLLVFMGLLWGMLLSAALSLGCRMSMAKQISQSALYYVAQAEKALGREKKREYYEKALTTHPTEVKIYDSLLGQYVRANDFQVEDATELMNILERAGDREPVLESLKRDNPTAFCSFCYEVGIGYFYHMNTVAGKKEARPWFMEVCRSKSGDFPKDKKRRAALYGEISAYYATFIENGEDRSGEHQTKNYKDFFHTLCELNRIELHEKSSRSQAAAAYLISMEVAVEISGFAQKFLTEGEIGVEQLHRELNRIWGEGAGGRISMLSVYRSPEEIQTLKNLVETARSSIIE